MQNQKIIIGVGGNIFSEDGSHPIKVAMKAIKYFKDYSINITKQSSWYETEPIPKCDQPNFFNCVVFANTNLNELDVLKSLHEIELIDYSNRVLKNNEIISPHSRAHKRRFVMEPLAELNPNWVHPILKKDVFEILKKLNNQNVKIVNKEKLI